MRDTETIVADLICPVCGQDYIKRVKITPLQQVVLVCEECRSLWELAIPIRTDTRIFYADYMRLYNLAASWRYVEVISSRLSAADNEPDKGD